MVQEPSSLFGKCGILFDNLLFISAELELLSLFKVKFSEDIIELWS